MDFASQQVGPTMNKIQLPGCFEQLLKHCSSLYPSDQRPYKCFKPEKSFLLEHGTDPLDYIYIYKNAGNSHDVPRHWHYISFGLSDIHGYTKFRPAHERFREENATYEKMTRSLPELYPTPPPDVKMNGFGFELTARIKCNSDEEWNSEPPVWPQHVLQDLARYVFQSRNTFGVGDHVAWHSPLDSESEDGDSSRIEHILMTLDPELNEIDTTLGPVKFIQIVGVCKEELQAARELNVRNILEKMKTRPETGGPMLITDMRRGETIFELNPELYEEHLDAIERWGSDMAQISNRHKTSYRKPDWFSRVEAGWVDDSNDMNEDQCYNMDVITESVKQDDDYPVRTPSRMSLGSESALKIENADLYAVRYHEHIYILLSYESARILPVMLKGRLKHKRPFSFQSFKGDSLVTFQPEGSPRDSLVSAEHQFAKQSHWLQIYVSNRLCDEMYEAIKVDFDTRAGDQHRPKLPKNYCWPDFNLYLTIVDEIEDA